MAAITCLAVIPLATLLRAGDQEVLRWFTLASRSCWIRLRWSASWGDQAMKSLFTLVERPLAGSSRGAPPLGGDEATKNGAAVPSDAAALLKTA
jgi:hypothetical protein